MIVEINYTENVTNDFLSALGEHYNYNRPFTKAEFIDYRRKHGIGNDKAIRDKYEIKRKSWNP